MTSPLGKYLDREVAVAALQVTSGECYTASRQAPKDQYLLGFADGLDRALEIVRGQATAPIDVLLQAARRVATASLKSDFGFLCYCTASDHKSLRDAFDALDAAAPEAQE